MLTRYGERKKPFENTFKNVPPKSEITLDQAMITLFEFELGYGGKITDVTERMNGSISVKIETDVLSCHDTTWLEGPKEEMQPILRAIWAWGQVSKIDNEVIDQVAEYAPGNPMILSVTGPKMVGNSKVKIAMALLLGLTPEEAKKWSKIKLEDLISATTMKLQDEELTTDELFQLVS